MPPGVINRVDGGWAFTTADGQWYRVRGPAPVAVEGYPLEQATEPESVLRLFGPVTALVAQVSGCQPLHAAGLMRGGKVLALCAESGQGKSTLAALAAAHGWQVQGDDLLAVDRSGMVLPLPGSLRVRPELAPPGCTSAWHLPDGREWYPLPAPAHSAQLGGIVRLARGREILLRTLRGAERLATVAVAALAPFFGHVENDPHPARLLDLAGATPAWHLTVPEGLTRLRESWGILDGLLTGLLGE